MNRESIQRMFEEISERPYLKPEQIPPLSLYIDQILTLFSTGSKEEQALTKAMVNNYSKEKMLRPIKGKKYSREQILQILLICRLKSVLSMEQIKTVTTRLMSEENCEDTLEQILVGADQQRLLTKDCADFVSDRLNSESEAALILELCQLSDFFAQAAKELADHSFDKK